MHINALNAPVILQQGIAMHAAAVHTNAQVQLEQSTAI